MKLIRQNEWEKRHFIHHKFHTDYLGLRTWRREGGEELPEPRNDSHILTTGIVLHSLRVYVPTRSLRRRQRMTLKIRKVMGSNIGP